MSDDLNYDNLRRQNNVPAARTDAHTPDQMVNLDGQLLIKRPIGIRMARRRGRARSFQATGAIWRDHRIHSFGCHIQIPIRVDIVLESICFSSWRR